MKALGSSLLAAVVALVALSAVAPALINLSHALLPVLIVAIVGAALLRLLWFHTRRW